MQIQKFYMPIMAGPYSMANPFPWHNEGPVIQSMAELVARIWSGDNEPPFSQIIEVDLQGGLSFDVTEKVAQELGERSFVNADEPYIELRDWLESWGVDYFKNADTLAADRDGERWDREHDRRVEDRLRGWR